MGGVIPINAHDEMGDRETGHRIWCRGTPELFCVMLKGKLVGRDIDNMGGGGSDASCKVGGGGSRRSLTKDCYMAAMVWLRMSIVQPI
jgi:hypothetical protein